MATTVYVNGVEAAFALPGGRIPNTISSAEDGPRGTLVFQVPYGSRYALIAALRGYCVVNSSAGGFKRVPPATHPDNPAMVCTSVGDFEYIQAGVDDGGFLYSTLVRIPAYFSCVPWQFKDGDPAGQNDASGQAWTVTKIKPSCEVYQPPGGTYYLGPFGAGATPLDEAATGFVRANIEIQMTRKFLPAMPLQQIMQAIGKVNSTAMTFGNQTFGITKLLLVGAEATEPYFDGLGNPVMDINFTLAGKTGNADWQSAQGRDGLYHLINTKADGTGNPPFFTYDFTTLPR